MKEIGVHTKHPLRKLIRLQILVEEGSVFDQLKSARLTGRSIVENLGIMLADIIVSTSNLVDPSEALVAGIRHILLVHAPRNSLVLEEIDDGRDVFWDLGEWVAVKTEVVTSYGSHVIWLGGMSLCEEVAQRDALLGKVGKVCWE